MAKGKLESLTEKYQDVLKELGNIGAGNAMTALAYMTNQRIDMKIPQVRLMDIQDFGSLVGGEDQIMFGIYLNLEGDASGSMLFLIGKETGDAIAKQLLGGMSLSEEETENMKNSVMQEVGNIVCGAYLNALSSLTNLCISLSPPQVVMDMVGAILSVPAVEMGLNSDKLLLIQTQFKEDVEMEGYFIVMPDEASYVKILSSLGMPMDELMSITENAQ